MKRARDEVSESKKGAVSQRFAPQRLHPGARRNDDDDCRGFQMNLHPIIVPKDKFPDELMSDNAEKAEKCAMICGEQQTYPFKANFNDHFETSLEALKDLLPVLEAYRSLIRPNSPEGFTLYDPYFCTGTVKALWEDLGIGKVIHEKRDFYADMEEGTIPDYDVLVTNPPYSDDHIQKLMEFLVGSNKAWAFLVPDYVASKDWYQKLVGECYSYNTVAYIGQNVFCENMATPRREPFSSTKVTPFPLPMSTPFPVSGSSGPTTVGLEPFYVVPKVWYDFKHPQGAGNDKSHFKSIWFVWCGRRQNDVLRAVTCASRGDGAAIVTCLAGLKEQRHIRTEVRKNPQQRARQRPK